MIRTKNPRVDLETLRVRVATESLAANLEGETVRTSRPVPDPRLRAIEQALREAEERSVPRTVWPDNLKLFPFSWSRRLQSGALRILALALRDQQEVNAALIRSQRELLALLHAVLAELRDDETD
jgi:hypothetical protein